MRFNIVIRSYRTLSCLMLAAACVTAASASPQGQAAADQVSESSYRYFLGDSLTNYGILYTHSGHDRGVGGTHHDLARDNIADEFESYGFTVTLEPVTYYGSTYYNVVATRTGSTHPDQEWIVGAHYDSVSNPGADDDASGVAAMLECARILSQYDADYTIRFVAFTREEQGLYGSNAYVDAHYGDDILGMVQLDMIAYDPETNHALIYGHDSPALPLKNALRAAISEYGHYLGESLTASDEGWNGQSDHAPFDSAGFQACLLIEGEVWNNPFYHTAQDSVDNPSNINYDYAVRMTKAVCGFLVDAAGIEVPVDALELTIPGDLPEYVSPAGGSRLTVQVSALGDAVHQQNTGLLYYNLGAGWQSTAMTLVDDNLYEAVFPAAACGTEIQYYVAASAVGGQQFTAPSDAPDFAFTTLSAYGREIHFADDFQTNQGWTVTGDAVDGQWNRGVPVGGGERGDPATDFDGSGACYLTDNVAGNSDVDDGYTYLISPSLDLSFGDAEISFALWYTNNFGDDPNNDLFKIYVSNNGGSNWTLVETVGPQTYAGWIEHKFYVGDYVVPTSNTKVRFEASDLNGGSVVEAGVDAFMVSTLICEDPNPCPGDLDGDDDIDLSDLAQLLANYGTTSGAAPTDGDIDGDGDVDLSDLAALLAVYGTTC